MKLSKRIQEVEYSAVRKLTPYADAAKARGIKIYELNIGAPDIEVPDVYFETFRDVKRDPFLMPMPKDLLNLGKRLLNTTKTGE